VVCRKLMGDFSNITFYRSNLTIHKEHFLSKTDYRTNAIKSTIVKTGRAICQQKHRPLTTDIGHAMNSGCIVANSFVCANKFMSKIDYYATSIIGFDKLEKI